MPLSHSQPFLPVKLLLFLPLPSNFSHYKQPKKPHQSFNKKTLCWFLFMKELTSTSFSLLGFFKFCNLKVKIFNFLFSLSGFSFFWWVGKMCHHNNIVGLWFVFLGVLTSPVHSKTASPDGICSSLSIIVVISIEKIDWFFEIVVPFIHLFKLIKPRKLKWIFMAY